MVVPVTIHFPLPPAPSVNVLAGVGVMFNFTVVALAPLYVDFNVHTPGESVQAAALKQSSNARDKMKLQNE